jgi:hypothetical protein
MSTESSLPENVALLGRVEAIENNVKAMSRAHTRSRRSRLVLLVLVAILVVVFVYLFLNLLTRFMDSSRQRDFATVALNQFFEVPPMEREEEAADDWEQLLDQYKDIFVTELEDLGKTSMPVVEATFRRQIEEDMGKHTAMFNKQRDLLVKNLQRRSDELLQERYQKILEQHKQILKDEFKDLDDAKVERMLVHFNMAMDRLLQKYYIDEIEVQINQLKGTYDNFPIVGPAENGETLEQQLLGTFLELLTVKLMGDIPAEVARSEYLEQLDEGEAASTDAAESTDAPTGTDEANSTDEAESTDVAASIDEPATTDEPAATTDEPATTDAPQDNEAKAGSESESEAKQDDPKKDEENVSAENKDADKAKKDEADADDAASSEKEDGQTETAEKESDAEGEPDNEENG